MQSAGRKVAHLNADDKREAMSQHGATVLDGGQPADVRRAAELLRSGRVVAFPTETVYGLGADATSASAVREVFRLKGRPAGNPLIVHGPSVEAARRWCRNWPRQAQMLADRFWPGPLTLVLPAAKGIAPEVLAGGTTVGVRIPAHPVALELLGLCGFPVAAPSANRSNRLSPTTAGAVAELLGAGVAAILDGGACEVGIESTVLDLSGTAPAILRPGAVSREELSAALGERVRLLGEAAGGALRSPGMLPRHYAPRVPLVLVASAPEQPREADFIIQFGDTAHSEPRRITLPREPREYASRLYESLLLAEQSGAARILVERPPREEAWLAVLDRLARASARERPGFQGENTGKARGHTL